MNCMQMIIIAFITAVVGALLLGTKQMAKLFDTTVIGWCLVAVGFGVGFIAMLAWMSGVVWR